MIRLSETLCSILQEVKKIRGCSNEIEIFRALETCEENLKDNKSIPIMYARIYLQASILCVEGSPKSGGSDSCFVLLLSSYCLY